MAASEQKLNKIFDQNVEITGTLEVGGVLTVGGSAIDFGSYLTSVPSEYLTQTEGDARYLQSFDITTQTDPKYLRSDTVDVIAGSFGTNEILKFQNNSSGNYIQIGFQQNDTDGLHHRAYFRTYKSDAGNAAGKFDLIVRSAGGGLTADVLELEAGENAKWRGNVILDSNNISSYAITSLNAPLSRFSENSWAGTSGYPGYTFSGGNTRFGLSSTSGVLDLYIDGNFYATDSSHLVIHAGNIGSQSVSYASNAGTLDSLDSTEFARGRAAWQQLNFDSFKQPGLYQYDSIAAGGGTPPPDAAPYNFRTIEIGSENRYSQIALGYNSDSMYFRRHDGSWTAWRTVIHDGNIGSQSVNYAAGADTVDGYHASGFVRIGEPTFSANTAEDTSGPIEFIRDTGAGWDDYIIKHGPTKGMFGKKGVGWHADSSSSFHVMSSGWVSNFGVDSDGTTISRTSSRAPVFYDYNDSNYYLDPNSSSVLNNLNVNGYIHVSRNNTTGNGIILADDGDIVDLNDAYLSMRFSYGVRIFSANRGGSAVHTLHSDGNAYFNTSAQAPIFYDRNNTSYYVDPDGTSVIRDITISGKLQNNPSEGYWRHTSTYQYIAPTVYYPWIKVANIASGTSIGAFEYYNKRDSNYPGSTRGTVYLASYASSSMSVQHDSAGGDGQVGSQVWIDNNRDVWMRFSGSAWNSFFRWRWIYNSGITEYDGSGKTNSQPANSVEVAKGESKRFTWGNISGPAEYANYFTHKDIWASGQLRTPIVYDLDDTNYYIDPTGTSTIRKTNIVASGSGWYDGLNLISSDGSTTWNLLVDDGAADMFRIAYGGSEKFRIQTDGEVFTVGTGKAGSDYRAPIFYDSNNTGYYLDPNSNSYLYGLFIGDNAGSNQKIDIRYGNYSSGYGAIRFHESGSNNQTIHVFSTSWQGGSFPSASAGAINLTGANGVTFGGWNNPDAWIGTSGNMSARDNMASPIYYDINDTGYYLNPNDWSNLYKLYVGDTVVQHTRGGRIGFSASGNAPDGFPYARINEAWGISLYTPDPRWAPNVSNASFLVGFYSGGTNHGIGNIKASGDIIAYASDKRLKRNIKPITNALNKVINMNGVYYDWDLELCKKFDFHPSEKTEAGVLAQEVQEVFPEVVQQAPFDYAADENGNLISKSGENYLTVKYEKLVPLLIEAVKELSNKVEELENKLNGSIRTEA